MGAKLEKLVIKNFRAIGETPVEIDLDEIVVLVGPNNVGKSSILRAYEVVMGDLVMTLDDFHLNDFNRIPEIIVHTIVDDDDKPGDLWSETLSTGKYLVKEKWVWESPGSKSVRRGFLIDEARWSNDDDKQKVPWGAKNFAFKHRPQPHRISAFSTPDEQSEGIISLIDTLIKNRLESRRADVDEESAYSKLIKSIAELQQQVLEDGKEEIQAIEKEISKQLSAVFQGHEIKYVTDANEGVDKSVNFFSGQSVLTMGPNGGYQSRVENQGSGARRTLLWAALKSLAEMGKKTEATKTKAKVVDIDSSRPQLLLMDEPEICLHPLTIREMKNVLYDLPTAGKWQVMVTTHSPQFIDFSKDNTTIVRVDSMSAGVLRGTTLYRPSETQLGADDKANLKYLNQFDPYVAEFFFGGRTIIVEGDTEYTAFNYLKSMHPDLYSDVHVIRARGKATIVSLVKILNHFGSDYSVLHDSDTPKTKKGKGNPAWGNNKNILAAVNEKPSGTKVRLVASVLNFEDAYLHEDFKDSKPYNAFENMRNTPDSFKEVRMLLDALLDHSKNLPDNAVEWSDIDELEKVVNAKLTTV
ncbi:MAG: AAA family ATPase [Flavobacteriales bacterium]|nr:AAA family ATPase [Flavobacteriales bacterium]